jgi:hypothetical protein
MRDLREAVLIGLEAVQELIAEYDRKVLKDIPREFAVSADILQELQSEIGTRP